jgi:predicted PurR-regulated permease PerM
MHHEDPSRPERSPRPPAAGDGGRSAERLAVDIALRLGLVGLFAFLAFDLFRPFVELALWTGVIAAALHPAYRALRDRLGGRAVLAAALVTLAAVAVALGPIAMLGASGVETARWLAAQAHAGALTLPPPPPQVLDIPVVGKALSSNWQLATTNLDGFLARYGRTLVGAGEVAVRPAIHFSENVGVIIAATALSGLLLAPGERLGALLRRAAARLIGPGGAHFVDLAGATVRNVARGVIGVAVIQALAVGIGLIVAEVPAAGVLTLAALILAIVQIGAWPVAASVIVWAWLTRDATVAALLTAYLIPAALIDVPLKPLMLGRSLSTPSLVIFAGVVAGTVSYGLIGLFLGPILLAIAYEAIVLGAAAPPPDGAPPRRGGIE